MSATDLASVGQHFMLGLRPGTTLDAHDRLLLRDLRPAGVIFTRAIFITIVRTRNGCRATAP